MEATLWSKYHEKPNRRNRNELVKFYSPWVKVIANKFALKHYEISAEDMFSEGILGLIESIEKYNGTVKFKTFAPLRVIGQMKDSMRKNDHVSRGERKKGGSKLISLFTPKDDETLLDTLSKEDPLKLLIEKDSFNNFLKGFNRREKLIIKLRVDDFSLREIGKVLGIGESRVSQILNTGSLGQELRRRFPQSKYTKKYVCSHTRNSQCLSSQDANAQAHSQ